MRKSVSSAPEIILQESEIDSNDLEAFYKLLVLENELLELKSIVDQAKKIKKETELAAKTIQEFNASRKK